MEYYDEQFLDFRTIIPMENLYPYVADDMGRIGSLMEVVICERFLGYELAKTRYSDYDLMVDGRHIQVKCIGRNTKSFRLGKRDRTKTKSTEELKIGDKAYLEGIDAYLIVDFRLLPESKSVSLRLIPTRELPTNNRKFSVKKYDELVSKWTAIPS